MAVWQQAAFCFKKVYNSDEGRNMDTAIIIVIIAIILAVIIYSTIKRFKSSWKGSLIDKQVVQKEVVDSTSGVNAAGMRNTRTETTYQLVFQTEEGKRIVIPVGDDLYNTSVVGDKFEKIAGEYMPKRVEGNMQNSVSTQGSAVPAAAPAPSVSSTPSLPPTPPTSQAPTYPAPTYPEVTTDQPDQGTKTNL